MEASASQNLGIQDFRTPKFLDPEILTHRSGKGRPSLASEWNGEPPSLWERPAVPPTRPTGQPLLLFGYCPPRGPPGFLPLLECEGQSWGCSRVSDGRIPSPHFQISLPGCKTLTASSKQSVPLLEILPLIALNSTFVYLRVIGLDCHSQPGVPFASGKWTPSLDTSAIQNGEKSLGFFTCHSSFSIPGGPQFLSSPAVILSSTLLSHLSLWPLPWLGHHQSVPLCEPPFPPAHFL